MATEGNDTIAFSGSLQQLSVTLTNAYSGYTITIDEEKNVNNSVYDGLGGSDILAMTSQGDALFILDSNGVQAFQNIEQILASTGNDIIDLSSTNIILGHGVNIIGGAGNDILWGNSGDDTISGGSGDDIIDGGPGNDILRGNQNNDFISGGAGNDMLYGEAGDDILHGGTGSDSYIFDGSFFGYDVIQDVASPETNGIRFTNLLTIDGIDFVINGDDLLLDAGTFGTITILDQFAGGGNGIDTLEFRDGSVFDLRSVQPPNTEPIANNDAFSGNEDEVITGNVLANDSDADGDVLTVIAATITTANGGTVELLENGDFTYTPALDFFGNDSFDYTAIDGNGGSATASVSLDVSDVVDVVTSNLDIRVSNGNTATKYINSTDGYDLSPSAFGITESVNNSVMQVGGVGANTQVSYNYSDANTASVTLDTNWNSMKNVEVSSVGAGSITLDNFVHTDVNFGNGGNSYIDITDAKRGFITTGDGDDFVKIEALTNNAHWSNVFDIKTGDGADEIDFVGDKGITEVKIDAGNGDDVVMLDGNYKASNVTLGEGDDVTLGGNGNDTVYGGFGDDVIYGGAGDDILYGGNNDALIYADKAFNDDVLFPQLKERKALDVNGQQSLGVKDPNLTVDYEATATLTFNKGVAGYNNSLGIYNIAADGTIQMASLLWENVKNAGVNTAHQIDIPVGENGGSFGFFIIGDGDRKNAGYNGLDTGTEGNIKFVYDFGGANERAATIYDDGKFISAVYDDGVTTKVLSGHVYHTTERGGAADINADGKVHSVSGIISADNENVLKIGFEDLWNLGDKDYEDVLFTLDINEVLISDPSDQGQDILVGGDGNDKIYGEGGDDILAGGNGNDTLYGGTGDDMFVFDSFIGVDTVKDFGLGNDTLNLTDLLDGYDGSTDISAYIKICFSGSNTEIKVNADGAGNDFVKVAVVENIHMGTDVQALIDSGIIIVDQAALI